MESENEYRIQNSEISESEGAETALPVSVSGRQRLSDHPDRPLSSPHSGVGHL